MKVTTTTPGKYRGKEISLEEKNGRFSYLITHWKSGRTQRSACSTLAAEAHAADEARFLYLLLRRALLPDSGVQGGHEIRDEASHGRKVPLRSSDR